MQVTRPAVCLPRFTAPERAPNSVSAVPATMERPDAPGNRIVPLNPLLSSAVTGVSLQDLTHHAVLLPVVIQDSQNNQAPIAAETSPTAPETKDSNENFTPEPKTTPKPKDDFDVDEYFARLQRTRYVSAPKNIAEEKKAIIESEENLEEINLENTPEPIEHSFTSDIAQNFSELPQRLPKVASAVFNSFSSILNYKREVDVVDSGDNKISQDFGFYGGGNRGYNSGEGYVLEENSPYREAEYGGKLNEVAASVVPMFSPGCEAKAPTGPPPVGGTSNTYRMASKKKTYAHIPGLNISGSQAEHSSQFPPSNVPHIPSIPPSLSAVGPNISVPIAPQSVPMATMVPTMPTAPFKPPMMAPSMPTSVPNMPTAVPSMPSAIPTLSNAPIKPPMLAPSVPTSVPTMPTSVPTASHTPTMPPMQSQIGSRPPISTNFPQQFSSPIAPSSIYEGTKTCTGMVEVSEEIVGAVKETNKNIEKKENEIELFAPPESSDHADPMNSDIALYPAQSGSKNIGLPGNQIQFPPTVQSSQETSKPPIFPPKGPTQSNVNRSLLPPSVARRQSNTRKSIPEMNFFVPQMPNESNVTTSDNSSVSADLQKETAQIPLYKPPDSSENVAQNFTPGPQVYSQNIPQAASILSLQKPIDFPPQNPPPFEPRKVEEPQKILQEPPKTVTGQSLRLGNKRPKYYSGPIEGTAPMAHTVKPVLDQIYPPAANVDNVSLFTPSSNQLTSEFTQSSIPETHNESFQSVPQIDTTSNVFDLSRPSYDQNVPQYGSGLEMKDQFEDTPKKESTGIQLFGSLKSKLGSVNINKLQNAVATFFDPAYYETPKEPETHNMPQQSQHETSNLYGQNVQAYNLEISCGQNTQYSGGYNQYQQPQSQYFENKNYDGYNQQYDYNQYTQQNVYNPQMYQMYGDQNSSNDPDYVTNNSNYYGTNMYNQPATFNKEVTRQFDTNQENNSYVHVQNDSHDQPKYPIESFSQEVHFKTDQETFSNVYGQEIAQNQPILTETFKEEMPCEPESREKVPLSKEDINKTASLFEDFSFNKAEESIVKPDIEKDIINSEKKITADESQTFFTQNNQYQTSDYFELMSKQKEIIAIAEAEKNIIEPDSDEMLTQDDERAKEKKDDESTDITTQMIVNMTSPLQLFNPVDVPLTESNSEVVFDADENNEQLNLISQITEETIETMQIQASNEFFEREGGSDNMINNEADVFFDEAYMKFGWPVISEEKLIQEQQDMLDYYCTYKDGETSDIGTETILKNASDEIKAGLQNVIPDDPQSIENITQLIGTALAKEAEITTSKNYDVRAETLDVNMIEQDAKKDFSELLEPYPDELDTDDRKLEREKSEDSLEREMSTILSNIGITEDADSIQTPQDFADDINSDGLQSERIPSPIYENVQKVLGPIGENLHKPQSPIYESLKISHIPQEPFQMERNSPIYENVFKLNQASSPGFPSYFDTGNYAAENYLKNSRLQAASIDKSSDTASLRNTFTDRPQSNVSEDSCKSVEEEKAFRPEHDTLKYHKTYVCQPFFDKNIVEPPQNPPQEEELKSATQPVQLFSKVDDETPYVQLFPKTEDKTPSMQLFSKRGDETPSVQLFSKTDDKPPSMQLFSKRDDGTAPIQLFSKEQDESIQEVDDSKQVTADCKPDSQPRVEEMAQRKEDLTDHLNFFSSTSQAEPTTEPSFNLLASYFATPEEKAQKPDPQRSFFELSQGQDHYMHPNTFHVGYCEVEYDYPFRIDNNKADSVKQNSCDNPNNGINNNKTDEHKSNINNETLNIPQVQSKRTESTLKANLNSSNNESNLNENTRKNEINSKANNHSKPTFVSHLACVHNCEKCKINLNNVDVNEYLNNDLDEPVDSDDHKVKDSDMRPTVKSGGSERPTTGSKLNDIAEEDKRDDMTVDHASPPTDDDPRVLRYHWFYCSVKEEKLSWKPFSAIDSMSLEAALTESPGKQSELVATDGGRYDVNVPERCRQAVYWNESPTEVRRCSWFFKSPLDAKYIPYTEEVAALLEAEYQTCLDTGEWHRRVALPSGECVVMHAPGVMIHLLEEGEDAWGNAQQSVIRPRVVKRGTDSTEISSEKPNPIEHLILLCHGIGSACDLKFRPVEEVVDDFRAMCQQLLRSHYKKSYESGRIGRVEVLPISWHAQLHRGTVNVDSRLAGITLDTIPKLRSFINDTVLDVLLYTSPLYCQSILDSVGSELARVHSLFVRRNPRFRGGVSLGGHSLGSVILFDILAHQRQGNVKDALGHVTYAPKAKPQSQTGIKYPQLTFKPKALYALGSPIALFQCVRGIDCLGEDFVLPTCPAFFNIFHPYDPIAYRIEPLIRPDFKNIPSLLIPHHKGRKRMHLEFKETMARVGADLKQRVLDTWLKNFGNMWKPPGAKQEAGVTPEVEVPSTSEETNSMRSEAEATTSAEETTVGPGKLNAGRRIDWVLQEAPLEHINEYLSAVTSHLCYWDSCDTMLLILHEIYSGMGISPDTRVPQQSLTVEVESRPEQNRDDDEADSSSGRF